ncbi:MAG TPA: redox-regulated ATPase YchF [bacterium]|nr:redox-regulated ATPase YchF [bacterium]
MSLTCGLIGLPNAGKSTLFRAITATDADIAPYPFTTIAPNVGVVRIPDDRLAAIAAVMHPDRVVPTTLELVDIAGLVRNAHAGEGLGNQFLGHIREVDALLHVVRCFGGSIAHVEGSVDPVRDIGIVDTELLLADLATVGRARAQVTPRARSGDRAAREDDTILAALEAHVAAGRPARTFVMPGAGGVAALVTDQLHLLTSRSVLYVANLDDRDLESQAALEAVERYASHIGAAALGIFAKLELELSELPNDEAHQFLAALGLTERGLPRLVRACQSLLGLRTFFSIASSEVRAWHVPAGAHAPQAAGRIHTDMERGFIRAEVIAWDDLVVCGSLAAARDRGLLRLEGKDYEIRDGDVITFRFAAS